jgi:putative membrane protein
MLPFLRHTPAALACAAALVAACSKGDKAAVSASVADSRAVVAVDPLAMSPAVPGLTDANIVAILDAANVADSAAGSIAAVKGTSAEVKAFGREMTRDHHAMHAAGQDLARKIGITAQMPAGDNSAAASAAWRDSLNAMPRGPGWDKAYIDHEVANHEAVLSTAQAAVGATQNADLAAMIQQAAPSIQAHLDRANKIRTTLTGG